MPDRSLFDPPLHQDTNPIDAHAPRPPAPFDPEHMHYMIAETRRVRDGAPPVPFAIMCHNAVPHGRTFRQWDTRGRLFAWVNRGQMEAMPRVYKDRKAWPIAAVGIPVVNAEW